MPRTPLNTFPAGRLYSPELLVRASTITLGIVFFLSAFLKAIRPSDTIAALSAVFDTESTAPGLIIHALVAFEMSLAGVLLAHAWPIGALKTAAALLTVFTIWIAWLILIDWRKGCGCGSWTPFLDPIAALWISMARNIALLLLAWVGIRASHGLFPLIPPNEPITHTSL